MATNKKAEGSVLQLTIAAGAASGAATAVGQIAGVALHTIGAGAAGSVARTGVYSLAVGGVNAGGNSAVAVGDQLYFVVGDTPQVNKKNTGVPLGKALGTVTSGGTGTIDVVLG